MRAELPLGAWTPDLPNFKSPGCVVANNCLPAPGGYAPFPSPVSTGEALSGVCKGAKLLFRSTGTAVVVGGTDDALFHISGGTVTETTGYSSVGDSEWTLVQFNQQVFAIDGSQNNPLQYLTALDSDTSWSERTGPSMNFATGARIGDHLVLGNGATNPYRLEWSAANDTSDWTASLTTGAGNAELQYEYGKIVGFGGDRFPVVFQEYGISRVTPNTPTIFSIDTIEEARGCIAPGSIVTVGFFTFFLAHDGFCVTDGNSVQKIGENQIDDWFFDNASDADKFRTHGAVDWENQCVVWAYYPSSQPDFERQVVYCWDEKRWSTASVAVDRLVETAVGDVSLEDLDTLYPSGLESIPVSLDSNEFVARGRLLAAFTRPSRSAVASTLHTFNGAPLEATFETAEYQPQPGQRVFVRGVYPLVENAGEDTEARVITRNPKGGVENFGTYSAVNNAGFCPVRADGRYVRVGLRIPEGANWRAMQGCQVDYRVSGAR